MKKVIGLTETRLAKIIFWGIVWAAATNGLAGSEANIFTYIGGAIVGIFAGYLETAEDMTNERK